MATAGQQGMIKILLICKFKLNEYGLRPIGGPECLPLKNPEGLFRNRNSTEMFCRYEQKK